MKGVKNIINLDLLPKYLLIFSMSILMIGYGYFIHRNHIFPYAFLLEAKKGFKLVLSEIRGEKHQSYRKTDYSEIIPTYDKNLADNGLSLVTSATENNSLSVRVIDMNGKVIHKWMIEWFEIWPDATHLTKEEMPKSRPGTHIHGTELLDNGDLVFNFEQLGLVRLDICGNLAWRLPYRTHHSIFRDEDDNLWVSGQINHESPLPDFPYYKPPFIEPTVLLVSLEGKILKEISIFDLLKENNLLHLLFMSKISPETPLVSGDTLHLNDVETFPRGKETGFFNEGDIMISFRNISTVLVFREDDRNVKFLKTGGFVRQHDPDFIDGNTISIFDNNDILPEKFGIQSRILIHSVLDNHSYTYFTGSKDKPFFTRIMGKKQWLENGNLLITEAAKGRAFEIDKNGNIVWEFINLVENGYIGIVEEVQRLPKHYTKKFFDQKTQVCSNSHLAKTGRDHGK